MDNFNSISDPYKEIEEKLANQKVVIGKLTSALSGGYAQGSFVFNTKYLQDTENFDKKVKKQLIKKTPALDIIDGKNIKASELNDLVNLIGEVKNNGNDIFKKGKKFQKRFADLFVVAALTKDDKGRIGFRTVEDMVKAYEMKTKKTVPKVIIKLLKHMDQKYIVDQLTKGLNEKTINSTLSKKNMRVLLNIRGDIQEYSADIAKKHLHLLDGHKWFNPESKEHTKLKVYGKSALKAGVDSINPVSMFKEFKNAKGIGKTLPFLNIVSTGVDVKDGVEESQRMADERKLKGNWKVASVSGGFVTDAATDFGVAATADFAANIAVSGLLAAGAAAGMTATAPAWVVGGAVAAIGVGAAMGANALAKHWHVKEKAKKAWNNVLSWGIKAMSH
ncbi:hypothetical protein NR996_01955 [Lactobacillus rodentium]|uniref:LXG domain-containing protein n=1 Tax=Lactobacillus rodentium TaxID=947835 RepID=A0A2Z6T9L9_9LACO|nr:hypothetical protein [Lactobacillus rodentium]MCR1894176.1 hypothetical protein [Lactobacillus rodentium]GBG04473.1 hypothetical protein LrDSM24759_03870 [Lactobacillus rodentium]